VTPSVADVARKVAEALADERMRRHRSDEPAPTPDEERVLARRAAEEHVSGGAGPFGASLLPDASVRSLVDDAVARVIGLGQLEPLLDDDEITDIHIRGCRPVWVKRRDGAREQREPIVETDDDLVELVRRIAARMGGREQRFDSSNPEVNLRLPDGSRLFAAMDVSMRPTLIVRRHRFEYSSLWHLVSTGTMERDTAEFLSSAVRARKNIIVAGGTGSGKTTLLRALINEIPPDERLITIEDAYEIGLDRFEDAHPDHDALQSRPANTEGLGEVSMADLTRMALRMDPDRVIVGEVRGAEAFPMLLAMSQGNNGSMCTMHADSPRSVFPKLVAYVAMAGTGIPAETLNLLVANAVHFVVHLVSDGARRRVSSIVEVVDVDGLAIVTNEVFNASGGPSFVTLRGDTMDSLEAHGFSGGRELSWA
jgi:Flp pilus assembly CpaF family ATPase